MNESNGSLSFAARLDNSRLITDAEATKRTLKGIGETGEKQGTLLQRAFSNAYSNMGIGALASAASIGMIGKSIMDVTAKFEKFGIVLRNTLGDAKGDEALSMIANFAATTPFQLDEVTGAFIKMANQGFVPTREEMVKLGDLASSTGKSFDQLAEAILDAQTGEFERMKEFGIKASVSGDKVTFAFKEQKTTVDNTASSIRAYVLSLGELNGVAGANAKISESLTGQLSNLGDKIDAAYNKIGNDNKGLLYSTVGTAAALVENYEAVIAVVEGLILVYGTYKAATMIVTAMENAKAAATARTAAIEAEVTRLMATQNTMMMGRAQIAALEARIRVTATQTVIAAEKELTAATKAANASMLTNPYVLAAMAITALGYAIYKAVTYQTELEKSISKFNTEVENEKDKVSQLFTQLKHAKEGTEEWKKAKADIISQWGTYLTDQQKELLGTRDQAEAQKAVNDGLRENIALRVQKESLDQVSAAFNPVIADAKGGLSQQLKDKFGLDKAAEIQQQMEPLIQNIKIAVDHDALVKAVNEWNDFSNNLKSDLYDDRVFYTDNLGKIGQAALQYQNQTAAVMKAFDVQMKSNSESGKDPVLTTYDKQIAALRVKKTTLEREIAKLKKEKGKDPMNEVAAKQEELDKINKQLGISASDEKKSEIEKVKKAMETAQGAELVALTKQLEALQKKKDLHDAIVESQQAELKNQQIQTKGAQTKSEAIDEVVKAAGVDLSKAMLNGSLNAPKILAPEWEKLNKIIEKGTDDEKDRAEKAKDRLKQQAEHFYQVAYAAQYLSEQIGEGNQQLSDMVYGVSQLASRMGDLWEKGAFKSGGMSKADAINSTISGATQLIGMVIGQAQENKRVMADYYASVIKQQNDYNLSLNEQLRLQSQINESIFFTDYKARILDATKALNDASQKQKEAMAEFYGSEAIVGKKNVVSAGNVLSGIGAGAAMGAGIGTLLGGGVLSLPAAAAGAVIGSVVGAIGGIFAKKKKDIVAPLLQTYPDLIKANGEFNTELAKTLVENERVTSQTKATLENIIKWEEAAKAAKEQIKSTIADMVGSVGNDLKNVLVEAFREGEDAAIKFGDTVEKVLEDILAQEVFNAVFGPRLRQLQIEMEESMKEGKDGSVVDDWQRFLADYPQLASMFNTSMTDVINTTKTGTSFQREMTAEEKKQKKELEAQNREAESTLSELRNRIAAGKIVSKEEWDAANEQVESTRQSLTDYVKNLNLSVTTPGLDLFNNEAIRQGLTKGIAGMSQDTADELNGRFTTIQGHTFSIAEGMKLLQSNSERALQHLAGIERNTGRLEKIEVGIGDIKSGIDTINLKGIILKK